MPRHIENFKPGIENGKEEKIDYSRERLVNLEIKEPVVVEGNAFPEARKIEIGQLEARDNAFFKAENCRAERVEAGVDAFLKAKKCQAGEVNVARNGFEDAKDCYVEKLIAGKDAFVDAKDCCVERVEVGRDAFVGAKDCQVGDVKARGDAFQGAERCRAERVEARAGAFGWSEGCLITEKVKAEEIGPGSLGLVVLGKTEGEVSPSVTLMKGKLEREGPEEIRRFFEEELKKSQREEESIYDYLSFFNWEGKSLKEGKEKLKRRYERVKEKRYLLEELKDYNFYFLIGDNSKREEILFDFERLKKTEKKNLLSLNNHLPQLEKIKSCLSVLSLDDWVKLGEYAEFLDFDEEKLKEIKDKGPGLIREALLNSPKENLRSYLRGLGIELKEDEEIDKDTIIAATVHKLSGEILAKKSRERSRKFDIKLDI